MIDCKQVILLASYNEWMNAKVFTPSNQHSKLENMPIQTALDNLLLGELEALTGYRKNWIA